MDCKVFSCKIVVIMFSSGFDTYFSLQGGCGRKAYYAITLTAATATTTPFRGR